MPNFKDLEKFIKEYQEKTFKQVLKEQEIEEKKIKYFDNFGEVKASSINETDRTIEVIATKEVVDRQGDLIKVGGIDINAFSKNPVIPFAHKYQELPVAKAIGVKFENDALIMKLQFPTKEIYEFGDQVFKMVKSGYVNAVSIGFIPKKEAYDEDLKAYVIEKSELLEVSIVPVPANHESLIKMYKALEKPEEEKEEAPEQEAVEDKEQIEKELNEYNKTILKKYRKYQVLLREAVGVEATEDEEETVEEVMKSILSTLYFINYALKLAGQKNFDSAIKQQPEATQPEAAKSLVSQALKVANKL